MKVLIVFAIVLIFLLTNIYGFRFPFRKGHKSAGTRQSGEPPPAQWLTQQLDHFKYEETRTWQQRYYVNDTFYVPGGPAFLRIVGVGVPPDSPMWLLEGQWIEWAQQFNAICFQLEHRFYGESHPTPDISVDSLQYLNTEQALADVASFRSAMVELYGLQDAKWIAFGGSYAGSLAAWFRQKYPHLVDGAVASSAPLLAEINFEEYLGIIASGLANESSTCNPAIQAAVDQIDSLLALGQTGWDTITSKFRLCSQLDGTNGADVSTLYNLLGSNFGNVVLNSNTNRDFQGSLATNITIKIICGIMDDISVGTEFDRYAAVNSLILDAYGESCLLFDYNSNIDLLRAVSWNSPAVLDGSRQWDYQTCTEYGWYPSSDLPGQPFGSKFPLSYWIDGCADVYGPKFNETLLNTAVNQTNIIYGGKDIRITKVIFPNGSLDPWYYYGILQDLNSEATALFIPGVGHCADSYPSSPDDPPQLIQAREIIRQHIANWLS